MTKRILLGLGSGLFLPMGALFFVVVWTCIILDIKGSVGLFFTMAIPTLVSGMILLGTVAYFVGHTHSNPCLQGDKKTIWALLLVVLGPVSAPAYWYFYIWKTPNTQGNATRSMT